LSNVINEKEEVANTSQGIANRAKMLESAISGFFKNYLGFW